MYKPGYQIIYESSYECYKQSHTEIAMYAIHSPTMIQFTSNEGAMLKNVSSLEKKEQILFYSSA